MSRKDDRIKHLSDLLGQAVGHIDPNDSDAAYRLRAGDVTGERAVTPYYDEDGITIYHGDCLEHLDVWAGLAEPAVMVADPPYGIEWSTHGISRTSHPDRVARDYNGSSAATVTIANDATTEVRDAALRVWAGRPALVFGSLKVPPPNACRHVAVYVKPKDAGSLSGLATMRRDVEAIYVLGDSDEWKRRPSEGPSRSTLHGDARPPSIWRTSVFRTRWAVVGTPHGLAAKSGHPHAKPVDVLSELIGLHSGVVVDPFMGSGSTLVAARELGRRAIGFELEERYCQRAVERLAQGVLTFGDNACDEPPDDVYDPDWCPTCHGDIRR